MPDTRAEADPPLPTDAIIRKPSRAAYYRDYYQKKRKGNPAYSTKNKRRSAAWRAANPDYAGVKNRERRADPDKYGADKDRNRDMMRVKRADPGYRERENARARARYRDRKAGRSIVS